MHEKLRSCLATAFKLCVLAMAGIGLYVAANLDRPGYSASGLLSRPSYVPRTCRSAPQFAHRGEPGYFAHLDRDNDGISCEPYPR
jgi:hypothetical protein